ncbi:MAG: hypothetical protein ACPGWR_13030 [Ardenticatenaceae bacterium]
MHKIPIWRRWRTIYGVLALALLALLVSGGVWRTNVGAHALSTQPPQILSMRPLEGYNYVPSEVTICGAGFTADSTLSIQVLTDTIALQNQAPYGESCLVGTIPAGLPAGEHAIIVQAPDGQDSGGYRIVDQALNDDLWAQAGELWEYPAYGAREQERIAIGLVLHRRGGRSPLANVTVRFYEGDPQSPDALLIGDGTIPFISPQLSPNQRINGFSTSAVLWVPSQGAAEYAIYAVIDPDNSVTEEIESNNVVSRTIEVLPSDDMVDMVAPTVDEFSIDHTDVVTTVSESDVTLTVHSSDLAQKGVSPRGVSHMQLLAFRFNESALVWSPVYATDWITFTESLTWTLHPGAGLHFLQAWSSDGAGNISLVAKQKAVNYAPACAPIAEGGKHLFRQEVEAGETLRVEVAPCLGDADLYIWPPDWQEGQAPLVSQGAANISEALLITNTIAGTYQIEVHGYTSAQYTIQIEREPTATMSRTANHEAPQAPLFNKLAHIIPLNIPILLRRTPPAPNIRGVSAPQAQQRGNKPIPAAPMLPINNVPNATDMFNISPAPVLPEPTPTPTPTPSPTPTPIPCLPIARGASDLYQQYVREGDHLQVEAAPCQGDVELYISAPDAEDGDPSWQSSQPGEVTEFLSITAPLSGDYQIEVYGFTQAEYQLLITAPLYEDPYESDDSCDQAQPIANDGSMQARNFDRQADVDWAQFQAISGTTYLIEARVPPDSPADMILEVYDACGTPPVSIDRQNYSFSPDSRQLFPAPADGTYYLRLTNQQADTANPEVAYHLSVRALPESATPGAVLIVAGQAGPDDPLQPNIQHVTNRIYRLFRDNGYPAERIRYLAPDVSQPDVDALSTAQNLEEAITQWAVDKVGRERPFTLYLMGDGADEIFYLNGLTETVNSNMLDPWLDALQTAVPEVEMNIIIDSAQAGSFIDLPETVSGPKRVVIASSGANSLTYPSQDGFLFSDTFLQALKRGMSLYAAFQEATWTVQTAHPDQNPWLDDNADGAANQAEDGQVAQQRGWGASTTLPSALWPPYIVWGQVGDMQKTQGMIESEVRDEADIDTVWAVVQPPSYVPPKVGQQIVPLPTHPLTDTDSNGLYQSLFEHFDETGTYRIVLYALDNDGLQARPQEITLQIQSGSQLYLPLIIQ